MIYLTNFFILELIEAEFLTVCSIFLLLIDYDVMSLIYISSS